MKRKWKNSHAYTKITTDCAHAIGGNIKKMKRLRLSLEMTSIRLTSVGSIAGAVTLNPIILGCTAGPGILIQGYLTKTDLPNKVEQCKFAYTTYYKILTQMKAFLRGMLYDETVFLSDVKVIVECYRLLSKC